MEITVAEQALYLLPARTTGDQAKERAWEHKLDAFGTLSKFLMRPKAEEIQVSLLELRYQPFWHAASHKRFRYDRHTQYQVPVPTDVQSVDIAGQTYAASGVRITLQGLDHCLVEDRREIFIDGPTGEAKGKRTTVEVDGLTGEFRPSGKAFGDQVKRVLNREVLFDIGAEALNLAVPGGAIALKLGKAVLDR